MEKSPWYQKLLLCFYCLIPCKDLEPMISNTGVIYSIIMITTLVADHWLFPGRRTALLLNKEQLL